LTQEKELFSENLVSFFKELDTRKGTQLQNQIMASKRPWLLLALEISPQAEKG